MERKKRGRPPLTDQGSVCVSFMLPKELADHTYRCARSVGVSVSRLLRDLFMTNDLLGEGVVTLTRQIDNLAEQNKLLIEGTNDEDLKKVRALCEERIEIYQRQFRVIAEGLVEMQKIHHNETLH